MATFCEPVLHEPVTEIAQITGPALVYVWSKVTWFLPRTSVTGASHPAEVIRMWHKYEFAENIKKSSAGMLLFSGLVLTLK